VRQLAVLSLAPSRGGLQLASNTKLADNINILAFRFSIIFMALVTGGLLLESGFYRREKSHSSQANAM
jgi:hypothetical protein